MNRLLISAFAVATLSAGAAAQGLNLDYNETNLGGGTFQYAMTLSVDNTDGSFTNGMGWSWIIFGDASSSASPLSDFTLTSAPPAPFTELDYSSGSHNGPTWLIGNGNIVDWLPATASDTLTWTGTSSYDASTQGPLFFSELNITGGAFQDNYKEMQPAPTPEPASMLALAGAGIALIRRRRANR